MKASFAIALGLKAQAMLADNPEGTEIIVVVPADFESGLEKLFGMTVSRNRYVEGRVYLMALRPLVWEPFEWEPFERIALEPPLFASTKLTGLTSA